MIIIKKSKNGQFYFIVQASNGKTLATSETYTRKRNAIKGAWSILANIKRIKDQTK